MDTKYIVKEMEAFEKMIIKERPDAVRKFSLTLIDKINELDVYSCDIGYGNTDRGYLVSEVISTITALAKEMTEGEK